MENLALIFLCNFQREHSLLKLKIKKLSPKINVKNIKKTEFIRVSNSLDPDYESMDVLSALIWVHTVCKVYHFEVDKQSSRKNKAQNNTPFFVNNINRLGLTNM